LHPFQHRLKTLFFTFFIIALQVSFIPTTMIDTSAVALLRETDPAHIRYDGFRMQFDENDTASLSLLVLSGCLTGITILFALLADFIVNPALMVLVTRSRGETAVLSHPAEKSDSIYPN